jgi:hypothetical protein
MEERRQSDTSPPPTAGYVDGHDLLAIALPWLFLSQATTTTIMHESSSLNGEQTNRTCQSAKTQHADCGQGDKGEGSLSTADAADNDDDFIRGKLARRAYHLPGNTYCEDYKMYMTNNHLIFGLFFYDKRSPVRIKHRVLILLGSLTFGLTITNVIFLWGNKVFHDEEITSAFRDWATSTFPKLNNGTTDTNTIIDDASTRMKMYTGTQLTFLWTAGSGIHAAFDMTLWHMISCGYCWNLTSRQDCEMLGWVAAISIVMLMIIAMSVVAYFRIFPLTDDTVGMRVEEQMLLSLMDDELEAVDLDDISFIWAFIIEFVVSLLIWTPFFMTTLFTGFLGCGRIPCFGGRPLEVWKERTGKDGRHRLYEV